MPERLFKNLRLDTQKIILVFISLVYIFVCAIPFIFGGSHPLGYDTGFYRRYVINPHVSVPNVAVPGLDHTIIAPRIFLDAVNLLGLPPDINLYGSYILILSLFLIIFYLFVREYSNKNIALIAVALVALSSVQYTAYWFMLYKNFFALIFFFLAFIFIKKKLFPLASMCALIVPISHQTTTVVLVGILGIYIAINLLQKKKILIPELIILVLTIFVYLYFHPHVQQKIDAPPVGVFLEKANFILLTLPLILFTIIGFPRLLSILKENSLLLAFGVLSFLFPLLSLPYYQRIFLFTDYWLIIGAAVGIHYIFTEIKSHRKKFITLTAILLIYYVIVLTNQIIKLKPLITKEVVSEINKLDSIPSGASVLTSARLTPWVQGWTTAKVYAPGILKDSHSPQEWQQYWNGSPSEKARFLSSFPKPLYIFVDNSQGNLFIPKIECIQKITEMLYLNECLDK